jgi:hypothetical protein
VWRQLASEVNTLRVVQEEGEVEDWGADAAHLSGCKLAIVSDSEEEELHAGIFPVLDTSGPPGLQWLPMALLGETCMSMSGMKKEQDEEAEGEWEEGILDRGVE